MKKLVFKLYLKSPYIFKRLLANVEAMRRDYYRRSSDHENKNIQDNIINKMRTYETLTDIKKFNNLLEYAKSNVQFYQNNMSESINSLSEIESINLLKKSMIRENRDLLIANDTSVQKDLWNGSTSGSTGSPLAFYKDRRTMKSERESYDNYYKFLGCDLTKNRVRISGVKVATFERKKPPFWLYIDKYRQL